MTRRSLASLPWRAGILFLIPTVLYLVLPLLPPVKEEVRHVLLTLSAVMGVHLLDRAYLNRDFERSLGQIRDDLLRSFSDVSLDVATVRDDIKGQTSTLVAASSSMEAMLRCGLVRIYAGRTEASPDMKADLLNPTNTLIRLIGISLNDFAQGHDPALKEAWKGLVALVSSGRAAASSPPRQLDIKILVIDPDCLGAQLRSQGESRTFPPDAGRLRKDVLQTAEVLLGLAETFGGGDPAPGTGMTLDSRVYRLPPILFMCMLDSCCYVQQYHFSASRDEPPATPLLKYARGDRSTPSMYESLAAHFDWIWKVASVPLRSYLKEYDVGVEKGLGQCGVTNVFVDSDQAKKRIEFLIRSARQRVCIQGNSLRSFFSPGTLLAAIDGLLSRGQTEVVKVLLLDPDCEQAMIRSYREHLLAGRRVTFAEYRQARLHEASALCRDTKDTIRAICDIRARHSNDRFQTRLYSSAPAHFMLLVDDVVLVEHYNYGKLAAGEPRHGMPPILGKDMPIFEYRRAPATLFDADPLRSPFALLEDHFRFVFEQESREVDCG